MEDKQYIEGLHRDDAFAFDAIFEKYNKRIYWFSFKYLKNHEDAEGVVQEVFLQLWRRRKYIKEEHSLSAYLFTISLNVIRKHFRQLWREKQHLSTLTDLMNHEGESIDSSITYNDTRKILDKILGDLPPRQQKIFTLSAIEGLSNQEIAQQLKIKKKTVENHLHRAKKTIREALSTNSFLTLMILAFFLG